MASTAQNNYAGGPRNVVAAPCSTNDINQGDLVKISSNLIAVVAAVADVVHGISDDTSPVASLGGDLTACAVLRPGPGVLVRLPLKSGDTPAYGDQLYISSNVATNPQEVSTSSANSAAKVGMCREITAVTSGLSDGTFRVLVEFLGAAVI